MKMEQQQQSASDTASVASNDSAEMIGDGEYRVLMKSLEDESDESVPLPSKIEEFIKRTLSGTLIVEEGPGAPGGGEGAAYGKPLSVDQAMERMPTSDGGLTWHATIIPDEYFGQDGKLKKGLNRRDFCNDRKEIKPRRPSLPVTAGNFFSSLTKIPGTQPRFIFYVR